MTDTPFTLPDLGESDSGELVTWLVAAGETVDDGQPVAEVETEKSVLEVPAPSAGTVTELLVEEGETVAVGAEILRIEADESAAGDSDTDTDDESAPEDGTEPETADQPVDEVAVPDERVFAPPRVRRLARELGVEITSVEGSETGGRINADDVRAAAESEDENDETGGPKPFTPSGKSAVSKASGAIEDAATETETAAERDADTDRPTTATAHAAHHDTAVVDELVGLRAELDAEAHGVEVTLLPLLIKAVVRTLAEQPPLNATVQEGGTIVHNDEYHIGVGVATDDGLVVPVVRNADEKTVLDLAEEIADLVDRAEQGEVTPEETEGGTFTLTNPGAIGDEYATLPIDGSRAASLGLGAIEPRPVVVEGEVVACETLPLSLSLDPRAVDATEAAAFVEQVVGYLESPNRLLLTST